MAAAWKSRYLDVEIPFAGSLGQQHEMGFWADGGGGRKGKSIGSGALWWLSHNLAFSPEIQLLVGEALAGPTETCEGLLPGGHRFTLVLVGLFRLNFQISGYRIRHFPSPLQKTPND